MYNVQFTSIDHTKLQNIEYGSMHLQWNKMQKEEREVS